MTDLQAWGWDWVKRAHLDQIEFKTGKQGETPAFELMTETANTPDERVGAGAFQDSVKRVSVGRVVLRTLENDVQSFFPVAEVRGSKFMARWKFRSANRIIGDAGKAHSAVGMFSSHPLHHTAGLIGAFLPEYPRFADKLEMFSDYNMAMELLPTHGVNLGTAKENSPKEIVPMERDNLDWFARLKGVVTEIRPTYVLLDCGVPVFIECKGFLNLAEGEALKAEGALYAYPEP